MGTLVKIFYIMTGQKNDIKVKDINILDNSISKNSGQQIEVSRQLCV